MVPSSWQATPALLRGVDRDALSAEYVERLVNLAFAIGPHRELIEALSSLGEEKDAPMHVVLDLFSRARVAEIYSLGQVARERVEVLDRLRTLIANASTDELELQKLIESAPWILKSDWTPLTMNQSIDNLRKSFEGWYQRKYGQRLSTSALTGPERPDFVLLTFENRIHIVEIKRPDHALGDDEYDRAVGYLNAIEEFRAEMPEIRKAFDGCELTLVVNKTSLKKPGNLSSMKSDTRIHVRPWEDVLHATKRAHQDFLEVVDRMRVGARAST